MDSSPPPTSPSSDRLQSADLTSPVFFTTVSTGEGSLRSSSSPSSANSRRGSQTQSQLIIPGEKYEEEKIQKNGSNADAQDPTPWLSSILDFTYIKPKPKCSYQMLAEACGYREESANLQEWALIRRLKPSCSVYQSIATYFKTSRNQGTPSIHTIYKVDRKGETFPFEQDPYRLLLWHGTSPAGIPGTIQNGLGKTCGGTYGGGCIFADRVAKSEVYCAKSSGSDSTFFILAEVAPGKVYKPDNADFDAAPEGYDSVKVAGSLIPDSNENKVMYGGAILPSGKTVHKIQYCNCSGLYSAYNEYIFYDATRIKVRFIVECREK